jgi:hypothetical protein
MELSCYDFQNPEEQPEFPVIERKYFVQFMFLEDQTLKYEGQQMMGGDELGDIAELADISTERTEYSETADMVMKFAEYCSLPLATKVRFVTSVDPDQPADLCRSKVAYCSHTVYHNMSLTITLPLFPL